MHCCRKLWSYSSTFCHKRHYRFILTAIITRESYSLHCASSFLLSYHMHPSSKSFNNLHFSHSNRTCAYVVNTNVKLTVNTMSINFCSHVMTKTSCETTNPRMWRNDGQCAGLLASGIRLPYSLSSTALPCPCFRHAIVPYFPCSELKSWNNSHHCWVFESASRRQGTISLIWINFKPSIDEWLHPL